MIHLCCLQLKNDNIKVFDLQHVTSTAELSRATEDNREYQAPEVQDGFLSVPASDIFSLALIMWELWYGRQIKEELVDTDSSPLQQGLRPSLCIHAKPTDWLAALIERCWAQDFNERPSADECLRIITQKSENHAEF